MDVAVYAFDGMSMFHLSVPLMVFQAADWNTYVWAEGPVETAEGIELQGLEASFSNDADLLVFPAWPDHLPPTSEELQQTIREADAKIVGLCLGAFPVAASGLLDGKKAVTHWARAEELAEQYPLVEVDKNALFIDHGEVMTSAGITSGIDACLYIVREHLGADKANEIARKLVVAPHREGDQAQYFSRSIPSEPGDGVIGEMMDWARTRLDKPMTVEMLANRVSMSPRHFTRVFTSHIGITPAKWINLQRLENARRLLETSDDSIDTIAHASGFSSAVTFRHNFKQQFSTTPTTYRRQFRAG